MPAKQSAGHADRNVHVKPRIPRPRTFEFDVMAAEELYRTSQRMPPRLWAAWIGRIARIQVNLPCYTGSGEFVAFATDDCLSSTHVHQVWYLRPAQIAAKINALIGTPSEIWTLKELSDLVMWLDTQDQRNFCLEAIGMLARDEHEPPGRAVVQKAIREMAVQQTLKEIESPPGREIQERVKASAVLTEPPEIFEAIKPPIVYADPHVPANPLNDFFEEKAIA